MSKSAHNLMNVELYEMVKMLLLQMGSQNNHQHEVDNIPSPKLSTCLRKSPATYTNAQIVLQGDGDGCYCSKWGRKIIINMKLIIYRVPSCQHAFGNPQQPIRMLKLSSKGMVMDD
jgi:hypothetical protein